MTGKTVDDILDPQENGSDVEKGDGLRQGEQPGEREEIRLGE